MTFHLFFDYSLLKYLSREIYFGTVLHTYNHQLRNIIIFLNDAGLESNPTKEFLDLKSFAPGNFIGLVLKQERMAFHRGGIPSD